MKADVEYAFRKVLDRVNSEMNTEYRDAKLSRTADHADRIRLTLRTSKLFLVGDYKIKPESGEYRLIRAL